MEVKIYAIISFGEVIIIFFFFVSNRFDEDSKRVELDYPRHMNMWKGVGDNIDAVFQWRDGEIYFIKFIL